MSGVASQPEVWLRGQPADVPALLQPVAHSLMQCREEVMATLGRLTPQQLAVRPGGAASVNFHVRHAAGAIDRLLTYARREQLSDTQLAALAAERTEPAIRDDAGAVLARVFDNAVDRALTQLRGTDPSTLTEAREVGAARLPSTVIGLLFHAAEHTQRHAGQAVTTAKVVQADGS